MVEFNKQNLQQIVDESLMALKNALGYLLLPIAIPLLFVQEVISYVREKTGLRRRTLEKKVVLITGASSGIGESLAKYFYLAGCRLILASRRKPELDRVKNDLVRMKTEGPVYVPAVLELDIGDLASIEEKCRIGIDIYGHVDILVNNAGISFRGSVLETELEVQQQIMTVNYFGALALIKCLLPQMIDRRSGHIVFMSSIQGKISIPYRSGYAASKHALQALADSLRAEVTGQGVQVTVISPGYVKTNISLNALTASGSLHGQMDKATAGGYTSDFVADRTFKAIVNGEKDVLIAPVLPKLGIFLRYLLPNLYFISMARRARSNKD